MIGTTLRNASFDDLAALLQSQQAIKHDAVVSSGSFRAEGGKLCVANMGPDGNTPGWFVPTAIADGHLAERLGIPVAYLRKCREKNLDAYDDNINDWLRFDVRSHFIRTFVDSDFDNPGICRAVLSDRYKRMDNLDVLFQVLDGIKASGTDARVVYADLSETRMRVRVAAPEIKAYAPGLLEGYRADWIGRDWRSLRAWEEHAGITPGNEPVLFAGFDINNSETGGGRFSIAPVITVLKCLNGWTMTQDILGRVHLGGKLDEGVVEWSDNTEQKNMELVRAMTVDAVTTFLDVGYVQKKIDEIEQLAGKELEKPLEQVTLVGNQLHYTQEQIAGIFNHFIRGGQTTAGGLVQAVTSYAQTVDDPDEAFELEFSAMAALQAAAKV